jgi:hypothetical protein
MKESGTFGAGRTGVRRGRNVGRIGGGILPFNTAFLGFSEQLSLVSPCIVTVSQKPSC